MVPLPWWDLLGASRRIEPWFLPLPSAVDRINDAFGAGVDELFQVAGIGLWNVAVGNAKDRRFEPIKAASWMRAAISAPTPARESLHDTRRSARFWRRPKNRFVMLDETARSINSTWTPCSARAAAAWSHWKTCLPQLIKVTSEPGRRMWACQWE